MKRFHWVRVGVMGQVGRYSAADSNLYPREARVVVRTQRGLELGDVLAVGETESLGSGMDGVILRPMTQSDVLLEARLTKHKQAAFADCAARVEERNLPLMLIEVEHLFDGSGLVFYFLGEETPELESLIAELTETYESQVQFRRFAEKVEQGCGPACGTDEAENGCGNCAEQGCAIASACQTTKQR